MSNYTEPVILPSRWLWILLWAVLVTSALALRPILPIDETRYISVAWEMWMGGDYLVPHLNGEIYSHKPPLMFWFINAGWGLFGLNDVWPRLVAPLFGLGCLAMTSLLSHRLWPRTSVHIFTPFLLLGCYYWGLYTTLTMFDFLLTFWTLVGIYSLTAVWRGSVWFGWLIFGIAIGLGALSKGPVILVFLLPSALFAPYWAVGEHKPSWPYWYAGLICSIVLGVGLALAWAIPAGEAGGEAYRDAILWGQSAGRVVQSFAHQKPFWWYLAILPGLMLPWLIWPSLLKHLWRIFNEWRLVDNRAPNPGLRLTLVWAVSALMILSVISGKQPHYLLPMFPAIALAGGLLFSTLRSNDFDRGRWDLAPISTFTILIGLAILLSPLISAEIGLPEYSEGVSSLWSLPLIAAGSIMMIRPPSGGKNRIIAFSAMSALVVITVHGIAQPRLDFAYDLKPLANYLAAAQRQGFAIANMNKYHGQYNFLGRLTEPIEFTDHKLLPGWLRKNPKSKVVSYHYESPAKDDPEYFQPFRGRYIAVWDASRLRNNPKLANR
jgi:4-amino-4-deoxy-L-arabinose transferase-like glycosyltransferase